MMWKNVIKPAQIFDNLLLLMDLYPTICEAAECRIVYPIDGISLLPTLQGKPQVTNN